VTVYPARGEPVPMGYRWGTPRTALVMGIAGTVLLVAALPLDLASHQFSQSVLMAPFGIVGFIIARRQFRNPIGWILLAAAITFILSNEAGQYALLYYRLGHSHLPFPRLAVFLAAGWVWMVVLLPLPIALFPDGRMSHAWRRVLGIYLVDCSIIVAVIGWQDVTGVFATHISVGPSGALAVFDGSRQGWDQTLEHVVLVPVYAVIAVAWVVRQVLAFRTSTGDRRAQLKWLISGGAIAIVGLVLTVALDSSASLVIRAVAAAGFVGVAALPLSIGVGVLKYRLYEIDRLVSRTLSYAIVTGLLLAVYVAMIALTTRLIPLSSSVGVAASTLAAAGLFTPVRRRVQRGVDRRFNRVRYDTDAMLAAFASRLRDAVQLETVRTDLLRVVNSAVEPSQVSLWIRPMTSR
jgi:hypothetical protein